MKSVERFTSRWGLILSVIGIAVGTGNIWRFPRIAAANGGGSFLIPWVMFLFLWSIPLIIAEFGIGKSTRFGTIGAFASFLGRKWAWMGGFVGFVATAIMFYYSVVAGWCLRYFLSALTGSLFSAQDPDVYWTGFVSSGWQPIVFHFFAIGTAAVIIKMGVVKGIERANRILIPSLLILIVISAIRAVTLPGALEGLNYMFTPDLEALGDYRVWLQALTQNAWDTGAGWGLILTYAVYMREKEDIPLNAALIGLGNNSVSLLAGIIIFCTVFAMVPQQAEEIIRTTGPANTGLTFIWIPKLFQDMVGGRFFASIFFLALTFAALSSLISMLELTTRNLIDLGLTRNRALWTVFIAGFIFGVPSALSIDFFLNQDWTWGIGLMISGLFIALAVTGFGVDRFREEKVNQTGRDFRLGNWYNFFIQYAIPVQVAFLVTWWFWQVIKADPAGWWNPFSIETVGTCILQWLVLILILVGLNRFFNRRIVKR